MPTVGRCEAGGWIPVGLYFGLTPRIGSLDRRRTKGQDGRG